jgi:tetraprenyl-beta-curcumene synthase
MTSGPTLLSMNMRYWTTVAPVVRRELMRWEARAGDIADAERRSLALGKLATERFNPQLAATLATLASRTHRERVAEAIVALQVAYDYLDVLQEQGIDTSGDAYAADLIELVRERASALPAAGAVRISALEAAQRCRQAQRRAHAARDERAMRELERWASKQAGGQTLGWREWLAGAQASVLCVHALIAAAADPGTSLRDAHTIDAAYQAIGALTMLDSIVDREQDSSSGTLRYPALYESAAEMGDGLAVAAREAIARARELPDAERHIAVARGVVAHYASAPAAADPFAQNVLMRVRPELGPTLAPTIAIMRAWRLAKRVRGGDSPAKLDSGRRRGATMAAGEGRS